MKDTQSKSYFATLPTEEIGGELWRRITEYKAFLDKSPIRDRVQRTYRFYYGLNDDGNSSHQISRAGTQGELARTKINHLRNLVQHQLALVTANRPAATAQASNSDAKSQEQALLATGILDYYMRDKRIERNLTHAVEQALIAGEGWVMALWDANIGKPQMPDETGRLIREGDVRVTNPHWWDIIRDPYKTRHDDQKWLMVRELKNKYELAAQFPDKSEDILKLTREQDPLDDSTNAGQSQNFPQDDIAIYRFFHEDNDAVPGGREIWLVSEKTVLLDTQLVYKRVPVYRITPGELTGTCFGYTPVFDAVGPQDVHDKLTAILLSNNLATGVQRILIPRNSNIQASQLTEDLAAIECDMGEGIPLPQSLQMTKSAPETYQLRDAMSKEMELLLGISSVQRGDPERKLSGSAMALLASESVQFSAPLNESYAALMEDVLTGLLDMLKMFATEERKIAIGGAAKRFMAKSFSAKDLEPIDRVVVEVTNALAKTTAGRMELVNSLIATGQPIDKREVLNLIQTGNLDAMLEPTQTALLNMRAENEEIAEGRPPPVMMTDKHQDHIEHHRMVADSPDVRANPEIMQAVTAHIQQHLDTWRNTPPDILMLLGIPPPPPPPMMMGMPPPGPANGPPGGPAPHPMGPGAVGTMNPNGPGTQPQQPRMPSMPKNPATGQPVPGAPPKAA